MRLLRYAMLIVGLLMPTAWAQQTAPLVRPGATVSIEETVVPAPTVPATESTRAMAPEKGPVAAPVTPPPTALGEPRASRPTIELLPPTEPLRTPSEEAQNLQSGELTPSPKPQPLFRLSF